LIGAGLARSACASVLTTMNSTPVMPAFTIRVTALLPPPPTPTTLIRAPSRASSSRVMRRTSLSGLAIVSPRLLPIRRIP
jgi:hypothetical protein